MGCRRGERKVARDLSRIDTEGRCSMPKGFISYQQADRDFAALLKRELDARGVTTWLAEEALHAGDDWRGEIDDSIRSSDAVVVIMSDASRSSLYVTYEWAYALGVGVRVIPVRLRQAEMHPRLDPLQNIDFTGRARPPDDLLTAITVASASRSRRMTHH